MAQHPHYRNAIHATQDAFFVDKEFRGKGIGEDLILFAEEILTACGAVNVFANTRSGFEFGGMLERNGYKPYEVVYAKRLECR